jgi:hypothetical protein
VPPTSGTPGFPGHCSSFQFSPPWGSNEDAVKRETDYYW